MAQTPPPVESRSAAPDIDVEECELHGEDIEEAIQTAAEVLGEELVTPAIRNRATTASVGFVPTRQPPQRVEEEAGRCLGKPASHARSTSHDCHIAPSLRIGTTDPSVTGRDPVELQRLYVDQSAMGHGVGATLMRASLDAARSAGHRTLWLGLWERNARAISFHERWQFETVGDHVFRLGRDHETDLIMARPVPGTV
jgi:GNAT superfamily N-acetyltransferase